MKPSQLSAKNSGPFTKPISVSLQLQAFLFAIPPGLSKTHEMLRLLALFLLSGQIFAQSGPANPKVYDYANPEKGRENYDLAGLEVNESRLYDFYQRQADYLMERPREDVPAIVPAYPGLDAGLHGHWGKHNQNNHTDGRWNDIDMGEHQTQVFRGKDLVVLKGISIRLGEGRELSTVFDPLSLSYRSVWENGFIKFQPFRWGTSRNANLDGDPWFTLSEATMPAGGSYLGFRRHGKSITLQYSLSGVHIDDTPSTTSGAFYRHLSLPEGAPTLALPLPGGYQLVSHQGIGQAILADGILSVKYAKPGAVLVVAITKDGSKPADIEALRPSLEPTKRWEQDITLKGTASGAHPGLAYIVDTIPVPLSNPFNSVMQLSGIAFDESGTAYISTLAGEVWKVTGLDHSLEKVAWKRFATGLNQPLGIHIDKDGIFVLDRGQIYRLHDTNNDDEADFYENYANDFGGYDRSHSHTFGLHRTADGAFHFTQRESILRTSPDQKTSEIAYGVRNCMGIGGSSDYHWVAPQEGDWTPASSIIEVHQGEFYGRPSEGRTGNIASPLCFIPRGVENSVGGMVEITSDQWGPFKGSHLGLSYGSGLHYLILRDDSAARPQGATVPLEGEFLSGAVRGAFHPIDGQLYLVGLDGWGDYSTQDGCFHRVRYSGQQVRKPKSYRTYSNGILIDFTTPLDASVEDPSRFFAQMWNYEFGKQYGSPEYSLAEPKKLGHDVLTIPSIHLLENKTSLFVELPDLQPAMQLHLRMHLKGADEVAFKTDLFPSPMYLDQTFEHPGLAQPVAGKPTAIALRVKRDKEKAPVVTGTPVEGSKALLVEAAGGLLYKQTLLEASPGQALSLTLKNTDVMPHNLVIVTPGATQKVGEAAFAMLNNPEAGDKSYVPDLPEVLHHIPVIDAETEHLLHFTAPEEPGDYPYLCTFPGHWQVMRGILRIR